MDWRALKPGDVVCTCRNQHRRIVSIEDVTELKNDTLQMSAVLLALLCVPLAAFCYMIVEKKAPTIIVDRIVYFADGATCHASRCLTDIAYCLHE
jgi:hypothetical protein